MPALAWISCAQSCGCVQNVPRVAWTHALRQSMCTCLQIGPQVDQNTGTRGKPEVLLALAQYRRYNGRMHFGILLSAEDPPWAGSSIDCPSSDHHLPAKGQQGGRQLGEGAASPGSAPTPVPGVLASAAEGDVAAPEWLRGHRWFRVGDPVCPSRND